MEIKELFNLKDTPESPVNPPGEKNIFRHLKIRIGILLGGSILIFAGCFAFGDGYAILLAAIGTAGFFGLWLLYLLIESIFMYLKTDSKFTFLNLIIFSSIAVVVLFIYYIYFSGVNYIF